MRHTIVLSLWFVLPGCASFIDAEFDGYVESSKNAAATPTACNPADPQDSSASFVTCTGNETCIYLVPDGTTDPAQATPTCVPIVGWQQPGEPCTYANECGPSSFCASGMGCLRYCDLDSPECDGGRDCLPFDGSATAEGHAIGFCALAPCDPAATDCTGTCAFYRADRTACFQQTGLGVLGAQCSSDQDCEAGLGCDDAIKHCTRYCRVGKSDCGAKACIASTAPALSYNGQSYGYCAL